MIYSYFYSYSYSVLIFGQSPTDLIYFNDLKVQKDLIRNRVSKIMDSFRSHPKEYQRRFYNELHHSA